MCHPAFVLRLSRLEQSAPFGQFWGIGDCVTCYGFGGGLCYVLRLWAVSVLRVTAFGGSCVTQCYVLQLFGSVTMDGVDLHVLFLVCTVRVFPAACLPTCYNSLQVCDGIATGLCTSTSAAKWRTREAAAIKSSPIEGLPRVPHDTC